MSRYITSAKPSSKGRNERTARRSRTQGGAVRTVSDWTDTAVFTGKTVSDIGVSDEVRYATTVNRRKAAQAMRVWKRTLPKGVKI